MLALFVPDANILAMAGPRRRNLLFRHLRALDAGLRARGGGLLVRTGDPVRVLTSVVRESGATSVHADADVSAYARRRDRRVRAALEPEVLVDLHWGCHVHRPGSVTSRSTGQTHLVFTPYHRAWSTAVRNDWPEPVDIEVLDPGRNGVPDSEDIPVPEIDPGGDDWLGPGGEDAADTRLLDWLDHVDTYDLTHDLPADHSGTSHLSADLHFGTLSPRHVVDVVGTATAGRAAFVRQLAWRDWYASLFLERPDLVDTAMRADLDGVAWRADPVGVDAWIAGLTGFPIVDAGMRELAATGWMHNRVRMITASFLVKDLLVDWRIGERHFRRELVDAEVAQNAGNWQWVAGTGPDAAPYFRVLNPVTQSRRFDPDAAYITKWVPELAALPAADRHAPWEAGPLELAAAGVVLGDSLVDDGTTYPTRIVDHAAARERAIAAYSAARAAI